MRVLTGEQNNVFYEAKKLKWAGKIEPYFDSLGNKYDSEKK